MCQPATVFDIQVDIWHHGWATCRLRAYEKWEGLGSTIRATPDDTSALRSSSGHLLTLRLRSHHLSVMFVSDRRTGSSNLHKFPRVAGSPTFNTWDSKHGTGCDSKSPSSGLIPICEALLTPNCCTPSIEGHRSQVGGHRS